MSYSIQRSTIRIIPLAQILILQNSILDCTSIVMIIQNAIQRIYHGGSALQKAMNHGKYKCEIQSNEIREITAEILHTRLESRE